MNIFHSAGGEVVVHYEVDSFEIDSSGEQSCANQHPNLPGSKTVHHVVSLKHSSFKVVNNLQKNKKNMSLLVDLGVPAAVCAPHESRLR